MIGNVCSGPPGVATVANALCGLECPLSLHTPDVWGAVGTYNRVPGLGMRVGLKADTGYLGYAYSGQSSLRAVGLTPLG